MQDEASIHTTDFNSNFLINKFPVGRRWGANGHPTVRIWTLGSFFWGYIQDQVCRIKPESIPELRRVVEDVAATIPLEILSVTAQKVLKRTQACLEASGSHLEHFVKWILKTTTPSFSVLFLNLKYSENFPNYVVFLRYSSRVKPCICLKMVAQLLKNTTYLLY